MQVSYQANTLRFLRYLSSIIGIWIYENRYTARARTQHKYHQFRCIIFMRLIMKQIVLFFLSLALAFACFVLALSPKIIKTPPFTEEDRTLICSLIFPFDCRCLCFSRIFFVYIIIVYIMLCPCYAPKCTVLASL